MHQFEVRAAVPGVGTIAIQVFANCSSDAQRAVLAMYPKASITMTRQLS